MNGNELWTIVELMGHVTLAGRLSKPSDSLALFQIDIPEGDTYRTEMFGAQAVYRIRAVSEDIARAYARPTHDVIAYDTPIVTRDQHESEIKRVLQRVSNLEFENRQLRDRLTAVQGLPAPRMPSRHPDQIDEEDDEDDEEDNDLTP